MILKKVWNRNCQNGSIRFEIPDAFSGEVEINDFADDILDIKWTNGTELRTIANLNNKGFTIKHTENEITTTKSYWFFLIKITNKKAIVIRIITWAEI
jgi:hypothetical protein